MQISFIIISIDIVDGDADAFEATAFHSLALSGF